jgi:hypothetical protein
MFFYEKVRVSILKKQIQGSAVDLKPESRTVRQENKDDGAPKLTSLMKLLR